MIRTIVDKPFTEALHYVEMAGRTSDSKPTTGIITGSKFLEVETGNVYAFEEDGGNWYKIVAGATGGDK